MSHADDGTLHAYLDGELSALEAVRLEAHLSECADCRRRLAEERGLVTRAGELLATAVPPERAAPPLHQLRRLRRGRRVRLPIAWAATIVLAVAVAWFLRPSNQPRPLDQRAQATRPVPADPPQLDSAPSAAPSDLAITSGEPPSLASAETAPTAVPQPGQPVQPSLPGGVRDAVGDLAAARLGAPPGAGLATLDTAAREPVRSQSPDLGAGAQLYPGTISVADARALLGADLVAVPALRVVSIRRARLLGYSPVVVVEQVLGSGGTIAVVHRRSAAPLPAAGASEGAALAPLARRGDTTALADSLAGLRGRMEVEVRGPLSPDSLSRLRAALRPLIQR